MMPKRLQGAAWEELIEEMKTKEDDYFYIGNEELNQHKLVGAIAKAGT